MNDKVQLKKIIINLFILIRYYNYLFLKHNFKHNLSPNFKVKLIFKNIILVLIAFTEVAGDHDTSSEVQVG